MSTSFTKNHGYVYLTDEKVSQLIDLYRDHEELWNGTLEIHNKKKYRVPALIRIARMLNVECFGPEEVNIKLKYLRNRYCQERKRLIQDRNYVPTSPWFSKLDLFLRPHIKIRVPNGKLMEFDDDEVQPEEIREKFDMGVQCSDINKSVMVKAAPPEKHKEPNTEPEEQKEPNTDQGSTSKQIKSEPLEEQAESDKDQDNSSDYSDQEESPEYQDKGDEENSSDSENINSNTETYAEVPLTHEYFDNSVPNLKSTSERLEEQKSTRNNYDDFGLYVASLLRNMPRKKMLTLQPQIVNVITVAISEEMTEKTSTLK